MDTMKMLGLQVITPFTECEAVEEVLSADDGNFFRIASDMFLLGYIEGKRAERARRKIMNNRIESMILVCLESLKRRKYRKCFMRTTGRMERREFSAKR